MTQHTRAHRRNQLGYSLAEVMVAMAILTIVILAALTIYDRSNRMFNQGVQAGDMQQSTRVAFDRLVSDIRLTGFDYDRDGIPFGAMAPSWQASTSYVLGNQVQPDPQNGHVYVCTQGGKSGAAPPAWPTGSKDTVTDGTPPTQITWQEQDLVHYQQPDEQIEYAGESAITIRANFDYNTETGPCATSGSPTPCENGREQQLESSQFPLVTTGNDEIVTYALISNSKDPGANKSNIVFYADTDKPRDVNPSTGKKENKITITGVDTTNNYPPYTLYRITLDDNAAVVKTPIADNIRRLTFHYYTNTAGTAEMLALPYGDGQYDGGNPDQTIAQRDTRATIKSVRIDLVGMNPNMDAAFNDAADTVAPHFRKYELDSLVVPRNIGKHGLKEFNTLSPDAGTIKAVCAGACNGVYVTWGGPTSGGDVDSYNILYDIGDCGGNAPGTPGYGTVMSCSGCTPGYSIAEDAGLNFAGYATKATPGQIYRFTIQTVNKYGSKTAANCIAVNVLNQDKPATPNDLLASGGSAAATYPAVVNGIQLYWTPISTHNPSFNSTTCTDGTTKTENSVVPGENVLYRIWRSKNSGFHVSDGCPDPQATSCVKQVLSETSLVQPSVVAGKVMWLDQTVPMGSCITYYYRIQAVTVPCCNYDPMNQGGDKELAKSPIWPDESAAGKDGQSIASPSPAGIPLAPTGLGVVPGSQVCAALCSVDINWTKVIADNAGNAMNIDGYKVRVEEQVPKGGAFVEQPAMAVTTSGGVTKATITGLDTTQYYQFTVEALDCNTGPKSTPLQWPCDWTGGTVTASIPNYGGAGTQASPYYIQAPATATVNVTGTVAKVDMVMTEGSTVIGSPQSLTAPPYTFTLPNTNNDGVVARVHFTITGSGTSPCTYNIDEYVVDEAPPACALVDHATDSTVLPFDAAAKTGDYADIILKNTSGDVLKPQKIYFTWDNSANGVAQFASGVSSVTFDQGGASPVSVGFTSGSNAFCPNNDVVAIPATPPDAVAANQTNYIVRVNFTMKNNKSGSLTANPIKTVCVQYQSPFGDIKTCSVAPNANSCSVPNGTCF